MHTSTADESSGHPASLGYSIWIRPGTVAYPSAVADLDHLSFCFTVGLAAAVQIASERRNQSKGREGSRPGAARAERKGVWLFLLFGCAFLQGPQLFCSDAKRLRGLQNGSPNAIQSCPFSHWLKGGVGSCPPRCGRFRELQAQSQGRLLLFDERFAPFGFSPSFRSAQTVLPYPRNLPYRPDGACQVKHSPARSTV